MSFEHLLDSLLKCLFRWPIFCWQLKVNRTKVLVVAMRCDRWWHLGRELQLSPQGEHLDPGGQLNGRKERQHLCLPHRIFYTVKTTALSFLQSPPLRSRGPTIRSVNHRFLPVNRRWVLDVSLQSLQIPRLGDMERQCDELLLRFLCLRHCAICHHPLAAWLFADENPSFADWFSRHTSLFILGAHLTS